MNLKVDRHTSSIALLISFIILVTYLLGNFTYTRDSTMCSTVNGNLKTVSGGVLIVNAATVRVTGSIILAGGNIQLINGGRVVRG